MVKITMTAGEISHAIDTYAAECESGMGTSMATIVRKNDAHQQLLQIYQWAKEAHPEAFSERVKR